MTELPIDSNDIKGAEELAFVSHLNFYTFDARCHYIFENAANLDTLIFAATLITESVYMYWQRFHEGLGVIRIHMMSPDKEYQTGKALEGYVFPNEVFIRMNGLSHQNTNQMIISPQLTRLLFSIGNPGEQVKLKVPKKNG